MQIYDDQRNTVTVFLGLKIAKIGQNSVKMAIFSLCFAKNTGNTKHRDTKTHKIFLKHRKHRSLSVKCLPCCVCDKYVLDTGKHRWDFIFFDTCTKQNTKNGFFQAQTQNKTKQLGFFQVQVQNKTNAKFVFVFFTNTTTLLLLSQHRTNKFFL